jgi:hypothetical protein
MGLQVLLDLLSEALNAFLHRLQGRFRVVFQSAPWVNDTLASTFNLENLFFGMIARSGVRV